MRPRRPAGLTGRVLSLQVGHPTRLPYHDRADLEALGRVVATPELADQWRTLLERRASGCVA